MRFRLRDMASIKSKTILICGLLLAPIVLWGQTVFSGCVSDGIQPIFAANIFVSGYHSVGAVTDEAGHFEINIPDSLLADTLVVTSLGYEESRMSLSQLDNPCAIVLRHDNTGYSLSEVVVQADPMASSVFAVNQLDKVSIYMTPAAGADPLRAISLQPYSTQTEEGATPSLRGSTGSHSHVIVNGVPIKNPVRNQQVNGMGNYSLFNADIVGKLYIYPSNPPLEYGNSIGGIVDLRTSEQLEACNATSVTVSLAGIGALHSRQLSDNSFIQIYGNRQMSGLYKGLNSSCLDYLKGFKSTDCGVNYKMALTSKSLVNIYAYMIKETYKSQRGIYNYLGTQNAGNLRNFDILNYRLRTKNGVLGVNVAWDMARTKYYYGIISDTTTDRNAFVSVSYKHYLPLGLTLCAGGDYEHNSYHYNGIYPSSLSTVGDFSQSDQRESNLTSNKYEAYSYAKWQRGIICFCTGVRGIFQVYTSPRWSYQASVKAEVLPNCDIIVSLGKYNELSTPSYYIRKISEATSKHASLDLRYVLSPTSEFRAAAFCKKEQLPLFLESVMDNTRVGNKVVGWELYGKYGWRHIEITGSYSYLYAKYNIYDIDYNADNSCGHILKGAFSYLNANVVNASITCLFRGGLPYTPVVACVGGVPIYGRLNDSRYNDYFSLDFSANRYFSLGKFGVVLFASVTNIANNRSQRYHYYSKEYSTQYTKYYHGRLFYFGFSIRF